jgi:hypothetical protein
LQADIGARNEWCFYLSVGLTTFANARNSKELSAVMEGIILELYSSIDCTRKIINEIYGKYRGIPDSTIPSAVTNCAFLRKGKAQFVIVGIIENFFKMRSTIKLMNAFQNFLEKSSKRQPD